MCATFRYSININGRLLEFDRPLVMGVLNYTTDSFYAASRHNTLDSIKASAEKMLSDGADILDIGACSSRPNSVAVDVATEKKNLSDAISAVREVSSTAIISADTYVATTAASAIEAGADIINDISAGTLDKEMIPTVASLHVPYIAQHMRGTPATMQSLANYDNVTADVIAELSERLAIIKDAGVTDIIIDPGFGFAKNPAQCFSLLSRLSALKVLECPILVGFSRKSMITSTLHVSADEALNGTTVLNTIALMKGAEILRVHDVKEARQAIDLYNIVSTDEHLYYL